MRGNNDITFVSSLLIFFAKTIPKFQTFLYLFILPVCISIYKPQPDRNHYSFLCSFLACDLRFIPLLIHSLPRPLIYISLICIMQLFRLVRSVSGMAAHVSSHDVGYFRSKSKMSQIDTNISTIKSERTSKLLSTTSACSSTLLSKHSRSVLGQYLCGIASFCYILPLTSSLVLYRGRKSCETRNELIC